MQTLTISSFSAASIAIEVGDLVVDGEAVDAVGVVVPESRALVVVNDEPTGQQLNVRVLDGALGRSAALLPVRERPT